MTRAARTRSSLLATEPHLRLAREFLRSDQGLKHLRVRRRADLLTIESGPEQDPWPRARLRRVGAHLWTLEMPTHSGRWQATPLRADLTDLLTLLATDFGWALLPLS